MGFMDGNDGQRSLAWKNYSGFTWGAGYPSPYFGGAPGAEISQERAVVSAVSRDLVTTNSTVATLSENLPTQAIGNGLTLSAKPDHDALGISLEDARDLAHRIERAWVAWVNNPLECDASGRHPLNQLVTAAYRSYLLTGEVVAAIDWKRSRFAQTATKLRLLDSRQIDQSRTQITDNGSAVNGIGFDKDGRVVGYWIIPYVLGQVNYQPMPVFIPAYTPWGRPRIVHLFDLLVPGQIRGLSPLIAALTPAQNKGVLREYTTAQAFVQTMFAATVESDLPSALKGLDSGRSGREWDGHYPKITYEGPLPSTPESGSPEEWLQGHKVYYDEKGISLNPGQVNHLMPGDEFKLHRSEAPNSTYDPFDKSLQREAAKAAGASYEDVSGDYSQTSFSASRLALDLPSRINDRRREAIPVRLYRAVYRCWLEEQIESGALKLPPNAPAFGKAVDAYTQSMWRGKGKAVADPYKQAQADALELVTGLSTYEEKLGERGLDLEDVIAQRKAERELFEQAGLTYPTPQSMAASQGDAAPPDEPQN
ncbi:phage portal protein [Klebsiella pneumoniae]|uniref:phage portal protein n=6 Tax=Gammaproteobacteria TaxID=1236 RepID=UPI002ED07FBD|nr:phage portal protein [Klebsiella pneumoniae]